MAKIVKQVKERTTTTKTTKTTKGNGKTGNNDTRSAPLCTARPGWMSVSLSYRNYKKRWNAIEMPLYDILSTNIHIHEYDNENDNENDNHNDDIAKTKTTNQNENQSKNKNKMQTQSQSQSQTQTQTQKIVHVEPFVTIGQLTHYLNPLGYTLPVVPEMDDLTIGGLINGTGIESSSHKHGLFHEIITEIEICLGDGTVVVATPENEYSDLFYAVPWSYGTIGLLLSAKLKLIRCEEFVKLTYVPFYDKEEYIRELRSLSGEFHKNRGKSSSKTKSKNNLGNNCNGDGKGEEEKKKEDELSLSSSTSSQEAPMFLEGLVYSKNEAVIMKGEFISKKDIPKNGNVNRLSLWYKPWFYKHVQSKLKTNKRLTSSTSTSTSSNTKEQIDKLLVEYIPLRDYYHRHTQSLFWEMELMIPIGNHPIFRYLLGWLMPPKVSFLKISQTEMTRQLVERTHVAQDFLVPTRKMSEFLTTCDEQFDRMYPLWLCLHNHTCMPGSILRDPLGGEDEMYIDIGVYGLPRCVHEKREDEFDMKKSMRAVVEILKEMNGFQMLYADVFSTREEFEEMFDHEGYRMIRNKYKADTGVFKEVYDKMSVVL